MEGDRERWNAKWRERAGELEGESWLLAQHAQHFPTRGKALDVVLIMNYLDRGRRSAFAGLLLEHGVLAAKNPTVTNLGRNKASPRREYLVEPGELVAWARDELGFEIVVASDGWSDDGVHEAVVIARRAPAAAEPEPPADEPSPSEGPYR